MTPIQFPAGVTTLLSRAAKTSNWRDANLVRWDDGVTLRPVGGWEQITYAIPFASRCRAMHKWTAQDGIIYTAYLCEQHCYLDSGGELSDITPIGGMSLSSITEAGYGEQLYSDLAYGTPRPGGTTLQKFSPAFTMDNWGEDLLFMTSYDGRLLRWSPTIPIVKAVVVAAAPTNNRQFVVTPEHHCMLFGIAGNFGEFGWCSQENLDDWNFASITNTAGVYTLDPYSPIVAAQISDVGISVHTPAMTHLVEFVGLPYIYRPRPIGEIPIPISAASTVTVPGGIGWVSVEGFWLFNGNTADIVPCPVWDVVTTKMDFDKTVREGTIVNILSKGEVWWFWVDPTISDLANRYIALDYRSRVWVPGYLQRTCGLTYANDKFPIMSDGVKVWKHEVGFAYPEAQFLPYLESQTMNMGGENMVTLNKILPDIMGDKSALSFRLALNDDRTNYATQSYTPPRTVNEFGWVDIRETARDIRLRIDMVANLDWSTVGPIIFDFKQRGKRKK